MKNSLDAQDVWMRNQGRKFFSERIKNTLLLLLLVGCFFAVAWIEVPY